MEKYIVTIGGRDIPLRYTMRELADIEEAIGTMDKFRDRILQGNHRIRNMATAMRIMGNAGLKKIGKPDDLTDEWMLDNLDPRQVRAYQIAVLGAFTDGTSFENKAAPGGKRDYVLEELERKKEAGN